MGITQTWESNQMNEQLQVIDISATAVSEISMQHKAFAAEQLGPTPSLRREPVNVADFAPDFLLNAIVKMVVPIPLAGHWP